MLCSPFSLEFLPYNYCKGVSGLTIHSSKAAYVTCQVYCWGKVTQQLRKKEIEFCRESWIVLLGPFGLSSQISGFALDEAQISGSVKNLHKPICYFHTRNMNFILWAAHPEIQPSFSCFLQKLFFFPSISSGRWGPNFQLCPKFALVHLLFPYKECVFSLSSYLFLFTICKLWEQYIVSFVLVDSRLFAKLPVCKYLTLTLGSCTWEEIFWSRNLSEVFWKFCTPYFLIVSFFTIWWIIAGDMKNKHWDNSW